MYLIEEGKAYLVDGEVAYLINFDISGKMLIDKKETIDVSGKPIYTYDEMYARLNVAYMIEEKRKQNALDNIDNEIVDELTKKIDELTKENEELKSLLAEAEKSKEEVKTDLEETDKENEPVEEETKEVKENKKNK